jgi:hypothetical protein
MDMNENLAVLITQSFEMKETHQGHIAEKIFSFRRGEIYPLLYTCVSLLDNGDGSYNAITTCVVNYEENGQYMPVYIEPSSSIKIINMNTFNTNKYFTNARGTNMSELYDIPIHVSSNVLALPPAEQNFFFNGKTVKATTKFLHAKPVSYVPFDVPIQILDGLWENGSSPIAISFMFYILNSRQINIAFQANVLRKHWNHICSYNQYIEKLKEVIDEYPYLELQDLQDNGIRTNFSFSYTYEVEKQDETFENVLEWAYSIADDIKKFTDKRIENLLQENQ